MILGREPALFAGLVNAVLGLALAFGLQVSADQQAAIMAVVNIVLAILVRQTSTPLAAPQLAKGTQVEVTTPAGEPNETVTL